MVGRNDHVRLIRIQFLLLSLTCGYILFDLLPELVGFAQLCLKNSFCKGWKGTEAWFRETIAQVCVYVLARSSPSCQMDGTLKL